MARKLKLNNSGNRAFRRNLFQFKGIASANYGPSKNKMVDETMENNNELITMSLTKYMKLLSDLNMLRAFAKSVYKFRKRATPEKIEEFYEICKGAI